MTYRISGGKHFGQIRKGRRHSGEMPSKWYAEIRVSATGDLKRFAGIWGTKRAAVEEVTHILVRL